MDFIGLQSVINNKIIIVWGRQTHPQLPADGSVTVKVTFPISFTNTSYNICHSFYSGCKFNSKNKDNRSW